MSCSKSPDLLVPALSYTALQKALQGVNQFVDFFRLFYDFSTLEEEIIVKLLFLEGAIYQADEENEENRNNFNLPKSIITIRDVFNQLGLWDEEFERLLQKGVFYWQVEREFCSGVDCVESKLHEAMLNKSFDIWMLSGAENFS